MSILHRLRHWDTECIGACGTFSSPLCARLPLRGDERQRIYSTDFGATRRSAFMSRTTTGGKYAPGREMTPSDRSI